MRFFSSDNFLTQALNRAGDIVLLNLLWLVCSLPIVTAGAATTALYYSTLRMTKLGAAATPFRDFFHSLRRDWKQSSVVWGAFMLAFLLLGRNLWFFSGRGNPMADAVVLSTAAVSILFGAVALYAFPVIAAFENTTANLLRNACIMSVVHFPFTLLLGIIAGIPVLLTLASASMLVMWLFLWCFFGVAAVALAQSHFFYRKIFVRYLPPDPETAEAEYR